MIDRRGWLASTDGSRSRGNWLIFDPELSVWPRSSLSGALRFGLAAVVTATGEANMWVALPLMADRRSWRTERLCRLGGLTRRSYCHSSAPSPACLWRVAALPSVGEPE